MFNIAKFTRPIHQNALDCISENFNLKIFPEEQFFVPETP